MVFWTGESKDVSCPNAYALACGRWGEGEAEGLRRERERVSTAGRKGPALSVYGRMLRGRRRDREVQRNHNHK